MRSCSQVCCVDEDWCPQKRLHQVVCLLHSWGAPLAWVSVLQQVHHRDRLLPLEEVDDTDQVVEETEARVHRSPLPSRSAHALALPAPPQQINSAVEL